MDIENIYAGCIYNSEVIERDYEVAWDEQLDSAKKKYEDMGYKVVFVLAGNSVSDRARVVLYGKNDAIPDCMQKYRHKYVRINGHWAMESTLGICDRCGNYGEIIYEEKPQFETEFKKICRECSLNSNL